MATKVTLCVLALLMLVPAGAIAGSTGQAAVGEIAGIVSITPVLARSALAVEIPLGPEDILSGFRWYNNDGTTSFPKVLVIPGQPGAIPDLEDAVLTMSSVSGLTQEWSEVRLAQPVSTDAGAIYVVYMMPAYEERDGVGASSGPGFGYLREPSGVSTYVSLDGQDWAGTGCHLAFAAIKQDVADGVGVLSGDADKSGFSTSGQPESGLYAASPNPANPSVRLEFGLKSAGRANLSIYNLRGQRVATLVDEALPAGYHHREWQGRDDGGRAVASGVYAARLQVAGQTWTVRLSLVR